MIISKLGETKNDHEEQRTKELKNETKTAMWCSPLTVKKQGNEKSVSFENVDMLGPLRIFQRVFFFSYKAMLVSFVGINQFIGNSGPWTETIGF